MVGHRPLKASILVRIQAWQPLNVILTEFVFYVEMLDIEEGVC